MRIALMPSAYAPAVGGVEVLTARLAARLVSRGHDVEVWAPLHGEGAVAEEIVDGILVRRFEYPMPRAAAGQLLQMPVTGFRALAAQRAALRRFRPDVLHVQCFSANGAYATVLSKVTGVPLVVTLQGETVMDDRDIYDHSAALRTALRLGLRRATAVTGCSQFTLDDSRARFGLDPAKARVIFNGVDLDEAEPTPVDLPPEYLLALGRVVPKKGFDLLLDAYARIASEVANTSLVIAGQGAALESLRARASELGLADRVFLPGRLDRGQVAAAMAGAAAFVMPSRVEPFGIVALEGWRAGVPVVVTARGGAGEFVQHDVTGLVADPFDPTALSDALRRVLTEPGLPRRLATAATAALPDFTWEHLTAQYEQVYAEVLDPSPR